MSVYRRGDIWWYEFLFKGERYRESAETTNKAEAKATEAKRKEEVREAAKSGFVPMTLGEAFIRYAQTVVKPAGSKNTAAGFETTARTACDFLGVDTLIHTLTSARIHKWRDDFIIKGRVINGSNGEKVGQGLKISTINERVKGLAKVLRKAFEEWGTLPVMPVIKLLKNTETKTHRFLSHKEEDAIARKCDQWTWAPFKFLLGTGARKTEGLGVTWSDLENLFTNNAGAASVTFTHDPSNGKRTKSKKSRKVPLPESVRQMLLKVRDENLAHGYTGDHVFIWQDPRNRIAGWKPLGVRNFYVHIMKAVREAKVSKVTPHTTRHTYASRLVMANVPLIKVRDLLGHSSIKQTEVYAHLAPSELDSAVAVLDKLAA